MRSERPRRQASRRAQKRPTSSLYLGYVDDDETPEMIMKKFEMLDKFVEASNNGRLNSKSNASNIDSNENGKMEESSSSQMDISHRDPDQPLSEPQMEQLFIMTSTFNVQDNGYIEEGYEKYLEKREIDISDDEERLYIGEDDFFASAEEMERIPNPKKRKRPVEYRNPKPRFSSSRKASSETKGVSTYKPRLKLLSMELIGSDGLFYMIKRKVRIANPLEPSYTRLPSKSPLPRTWARRISPYTGINHEYHVGGSVYMETDIKTFDFSSLGRKFQCVLLDPPWNLSSYSHTSHLSTLHSDPNRISCDELYNLRIDKIMDSGLLCIWVEKEAIYDCIKVASQWGFYYVENLVWVKSPITQRNISSYLERQHEMPRLATNVFSKAKISLLIFRKGSNLQLRHQRNPDVVFDFIKCGSKYLTEDKPKYVYTILETLLPDTLFQRGSDPNSGLLLEIWAKRGSKRTGWTSISQIVTQQATKLQSFDEIVSIPLEE